MQAFLWSQSNRFVSFFRTSVVCQHSIENIRSNCEHESKKSLSDFKMISFRSPHILQTMIGKAHLLPNYLTEQIIVPFVISIFPLAIIIAGTVDFILNCRENLIRACNALIPVLGYVVMLTIYWHFTINRQRFYLIFDEMKVIVGTSTNDNCLHPPGLTGLFLISGWKYQAAIYVETEKEIKYFVRSCWNYIVLPIVGMSCMPCVMAAYFWCIGNYSLKSWIFFYNLWWAMVFGELMPKLKLNRISSGLDYRTPFVIDSTAKSILVVTWQFCSLFCVMSIFYLMMSVVIELTAYAESLLRDVKTIFNEMDRLVKADSNDTIVETIENCVKALVLHERINEYGFDPVGGSSSSKNSLIPGACHDSEIWWISSHWMWLCRWAYVSVLASISSNK